MYKRQLLLIDLDHFKAVNDTWGHVTGDEILRDFSTRVAAMLPDRYPFARWGGEEFVVLLPGMHVQEAVELAEAIRARIAFEAEPSLPAYTCSIGVACRTATCVAIEQIIRDGDDALYRAKRGGRDRVEAPPWVSSAKTPLCEQ